MNNHKVRNSDNDKKNDSRVILKKIEGDSN